MPVPTPSRAQRSARTAPVICGTPAPGRDRARPLPSYRKPPTYSPRNRPPAHPQGWDSKGGGRSPLPLVVSRGSRGEIPKSPRESFLGSARGYSFDLKRISPRKLPIFIGTTAPARRAGDSRPQSGARCRRSSPAPPPRRNGGTTPAPTRGPKKLPIFIGHPRPPFGGPIQRKR